LSADEINDLITVQSIPSPNSSELNNSNLTTPLSASQCQSFHFILFEKSKDMVEDDQSSAIIVENVDECTMKNTNVELHEEIKHRK
jgi:hypothetical protein